MKSPVRVFMALAILLATATVTAQVYKWIDKDGRVQYTDTPPPANATKTEAKKLAVPTSSSATNSAAASASPAKSLTERSKEFDKRRTDTAEKAKKDEEADKVAKQNQDRCKEANRYLSSLESGTPLLRNNDKGERGLMTDDERAAETARAKAAASESCKS